MRLASIEVVNDVEDAQAPVAGAVRLTVRWPQTAGSGSHFLRRTIRAVVRLLPPEEYRDPGAWSRTDYLLDQGITATASVNIARD